MDDSVIGGTTPWAGFCETHISAVFFVGDRVLKVKKPVRTSFLDYTTVQQRAAACDAEVTLNRRLSPDVYLGVAHVALHDAGPGEPIVVMRRLADADQLASRIDSSTRVSEDELRELAKQVAAFHAECPVEDSADSAGSWSVMHEAWLRECDELDQLGDQVAPAADRIELRLLGLRYLAGRKSLFDDRVRRGHVRECHGDLRCDHVYFTPDGPRVIDCVEFDRSLRINDVLSDVAFLAMDLERRGAVELARTFLAAYREFSGETYPESLLAFYVALRAVVRAKVEAIRTGQQASQESEDANDLGNPIRLAIKHLRRAIPMVAVIGGLPGSGKTAISDAYAATAGVVHISSDEIRHGRQSIAHDRDEGGWEVGAYAPEMTAIVYEELIRRARAALNSGFSVILDASWHSATERNRVLQLCRDTWSIPIELVCEVPEHLAYPRLTRTRDGYSQAGVTIRRRMITNYDPWPTAAVISTGGSITESIAQLGTLVEAMRARHAMINHTGLELTEPLAKAPTA